MQNTQHRIQLNLFNYGASYRLLDVVYLLLSMFSWAIPSSAPRSISPRSFGWSFLKWPPATPSPI